LKRETCLPGEGGTHAPQAPPYVSLILNLAADRAYVMRRRRKASMSCRGGEGGTTSYHSRHREVAASARPRPRTGRSSRRQVRDPSPHWEAATPASLGPRAGESETHGGHHASEGRILHREAAAPACPRLRIGTWTRWPPPCPPL
jgi:hypothetical protein